MLAIIYGSFFILCNGCALASVATQGAQKNFFGGGDPQQAQMQKQVEETMERDVPLYRAVQIFSPIIGLVFSSAMLVAGIGLLGVYSWARFLAIATVMLAVLFSIVQTFYQLVFLLPGMNRVFSDVLPNAMAKAGPAPPPALMQIVQAAMVAGAVITVLIQLGVIVYLLVIMFLLLGRKARAAFAGVMPETAIKVPEGEEPDEGWAKSAPATGIQLPEGEKQDEGWGQSAPPKKPEDDWRIQ